MQIQRISKKGPQGKQLLEPQVPMESGERERIPFKLILGCRPLLLDHDIALKLNHETMLSVGPYKHRKTG